VEQPRRRLASSHEIRLLSVFDLPRQAWDPGRVTPGSLDELLARLAVTGTGLLRTDNTVRRLRRHSS
jgi:hypothetical protein